MRPFRLIHSKAHGGIKRQHFDHDWSVHLHRSSIYVHDQAVPVTGYHRAQLAGSETLGHIRYYVESQQQNFTYPQTKKGAFLRIYVVFSCALTAKQDPYNRRLLASLFGCDPRARNALESCRYHQRWPGCQ
jgi:hypothetical protein